MQQVAPRSLATWPEQRARYSGGRGPRGARATAGLPREAAHSRGAAPSWRRPLGRPAPLRSRRPRRSPLLTPVAVGDAPRPVRLGLRLFAPRQLLLLRLLVLAPVARLELLDGVRRRARAALGEVALLYGLEKLRPAECAWRVGGAVVRERGWQAGKRPRGAEGGHYVGGGRGVRGSRTRGGAKAEGPARSRTYMVVAGAV